jgi:hypothetical protein
LLIGRDSWINEALYKADGAKSHQLMREDPKVYEEVRLLFIPCFLALNA